jgi:hypothetical protein
MMTAPSTSDAPAREARRRAVITADRVLALLILLMVLAWLRSYFVRDAFIRTIGSHDLELYTVPHAFLLKHCTAQTPPRNGWRITDQYHGQSFLQQFAPHKEPLPGRAWAFSGPPERIAADRKRMLATMPPQKYSYHALGFSYRPSLPYTSGGRSIGIPFWAPILLCAAIYWRARRRRLSRPPSFPVVLRNEKL